MTRYLSVRTVAERLDCEPSTVRSMLASGALTRYDFGRRMTRISEVELEAYIERCRASGESSGTEDGLLPSEDAETINNVVRLERLIATELNKQSGA